MAANTFYSTSQEAQNWYGYPLSFAASISYPLLISSRQEQGAWQHQMPMPPQMVVPQEMSMQQHIALQQPYSGWQQPYWVPQQGPFAEQYVTSCSPFLMRLANLIQATWSLTTAHGLPCSAWRLPGVSGAHADPSPSTSPRDCIRQSCIRHLGARAVPAAMATASGV